MNKARSDREDKDTSGISGHAWVVAGTLSRMVYGIVVLRVAARSFGIESLVTVGQLLSVMSILLVASTLGTHRGLTQRHAEDRFHPSLLRPVNAAAGAITLASSLALGIAIFIWRSPLEVALFVQPNSAGVLLALAVSVPIYGLNAQIIAVAAGQGLAPRAARSSMAASAAGIALVSASSSSDLALLLTVVALQGAVNLTFHALFFWRSSIRADWGLAPNTELPGPSRRAVRTESIFLLAYAGAVLIPVFLQQGTRIATRQALTGNLGVEAAGLWEAVAKLQEGYVQLLGALLVTMLLPALARSDSHASSFDLKRRYVAAASASLAAGAIVASVFGGTILAVLYANGARSGGNLLALAFAGDAVRVGFYVNQIHLLATRRLGAFLAAEVVASCGLLGAATIGARTGDLTTVYTLFLAQAVALSAFSFLLNSRTTKRTEKL